MESYLRIKFSLKAWSFSAIHGKMTILLIFCKICLMCVLFSRLFSIFTNIRYLCLYFWVICAQNSTAVANLGQTIFFFFLGGLGGGGTENSIVSLLKLYFSTLEWLLQKNYFAQKWNQIASSTTRTFAMNDHFYLTFPDVKKLSLHFWVILIQVFESSYFIRKTCVKK